MTEPFWSNGIATLYQADAREIPLPDASVHCVVTSPPYWGLRDYGLGEWEGGDAECDHVIVERPAFDGYSKASTPMWRNRNSEPVNYCRCGAVTTPAGIGLEPTLGEWVRDLVAVMREVWRVLRDDGTVWLNLGDAYAGSGKGHAEHHANPGLSKSFSRNGDTRQFTDDALPAKNIMGQPWRVAFALQDDGWILRSPIVWHKPNPMPESVTDRPTSAYEMVFLLAKQSRYYYDAEGDSGICHKPIDAQHI